MGRRAKLYAVGGEWHSLRSWAAILGTTQWRLKRQWGLLKSKKRKKRQQSVDAAENRRKRSRVHYKARKRAGLCTVYGCGQPAPGAAYCPPCRLKLNARTRQAKRDGRARDAAILAVA